MISISSTLISNSLSTKCLRDENHQTDENNKNDESNKQNDAIIDDNAQLTTIIMPCSLPINYQQCQATLSSSKYFQLTGHDNLSIRRNCYQFESINESQIITEEINNINKCEWDNSNRHLALSNDLSKNVLTDTILMANNCWPGDRIFDKQVAKDRCIKYYDGYLADMMSKISGLPITVEQLPNISPSGIVIDHMHNYERCSAQCIATEHVLSCFHSSTFFGSRVLTSSTSTMKPRCPEGKRFLIVGAGPAGLFMAIQCLLRGHAVTLIEQRTIYNRAVACGLLEMEMKFFQLIGLPSCFFIRATHDVKDIGVYIADIEEIMMKIAMKMGALVYLGCQFEPTRQMISSSSESKPGIRCWDGVSVHQEIYTDYDVLVYATGNTKSIPLDLFKLKPPRLFSEIFKEFHYLWSSDSKSSLGNNLAADFHRIHRQRHSNSQSSCAINPSYHLNCNYSAIKQFLLDTSYEGGAIIVSRLGKKEKYLDHWLRTVKQQNIVLLSQQSLLAVVAHIPVSVFVSSRPLQQVAKIPDDWIYCPCFRSFESINNNQVHTIQCEGPLPIHYHLHAEQFPVYKFFTSFLQNYFNMSLNKTQWQRWCQQDALFENYSQRSIRAFPQRFQTLLQYGRLYINQTETGDVVLDHARSKSSMWGYFIDPIHSTQKEFLIIGDSLCTPYYRFGIGLHNATRTALSYFHSDSNERLRQILDVEVSLVKQIILTLFSQSSSFKINQSDPDLLDLIKTTLEKEF